jgi:hypothetical protein
LGSRGNSDTDCWLGLVGLVGAIFFTSPHLLLFSDLFVVVVALSVASLAIVTTTDLCIMSALPPGWEQKQLPDVWLSLLGACPCARVRRVRGA